MIKKRPGFIKHIHVYTGEGGGKTTAALGTALRSVGHGHKVIIVQFLKGRKDIGEYKIRGRLSPEYEIYQFGSPTFINIRNPSQIDLKMAQEGLKYSAQAIERGPELLVLDEINLAMSVGLLKVEAVLEVLDQLKDNTVALLTGRRAPKEILDKADFATEVREIKHPLKIGITACEGIHY
jgi:cob(I)alamin adenosyltransferase